MGNCLTVSNDEPHHTKVLGDGDSFIDEDDGYGVSGNKKNKVRNQSKKSHTVSKNYFAKNVSKDGGNGLQPTLLRAGGTTRPMEETECSTDGDIRQSSPLSMTTMPLSPDSTIVGPVSCSLISPQNGVVKFDSNSIPESHTTVELSAVRHNHTESPVSGEHTSRPFDSALNNNATHTTTTELISFSKSHEYAQASSASNPASSLETNNKTSIAVDIPTASLQKGKKATRRRRHTHHHPAGRALQCRLQRARSMQNALMMSMNGNIHGEVNSTGHGEDEESASYASSSYYTSVGSGSIATTSSYSSSSHLQHQVLSNRYNSILSNVSSDGANALHEEEEEDEFFKAAAAATTTRAEPIGVDDTGAIWRQIDANDPVLCTCFSRTLTTTSNDPDLIYEPKCTPLHIAIGTSNGNVHVHEIVGASYDTESDRTVEVSKAVGNRNTVKVDGKVRSVDFSPDGRFLAVGGDSGFCTVFQLVTTTATSDVDCNDDAASKGLIDIEPVAQIERIDRVYSVQFSPDGIYLAVGGFDGKVAIFETEHLFAPPRTTSISAVVEPIVEILREGLVLTLDWSPDGRYLAIGGSDKCCAIVNTTTSTWKVFREIRRTTTIHSVKWHPGSGRNSTGGRYLAIGSSDVAIVVGRDPFPTLTEIDLRESSADNHDLDVSERSVYRTNAMCWSPTGSYLVVCGSDKKCSVLETRAYTIVHAIVRSGNLTCVAWGQLQNQQPNTGHLYQRFLSIGSDDTTVVLLKSGIETNTFNHHLRHRHHHRGGSSVSSSRTDTTDANSYYSTTTTGTSSSYFTENQSVKNQQHTQQRRDGGPSSNFWVLSEDAFCEMEDIPELSTTNEKNGMTDEKTNLSNTNNMSKQVNSDVFHSFSEQTNGSAPIPITAHEQLESEVNAAANATTTVHPQSASRLNIVTVAFSKGSKTKGSLYLAYSSMDGTVMVRNVQQQQPQHYNVQTSTALAQLKEQWNVLAELKFPKLVQTIAFSNSINQFLALGSIDCNVYIADTTQMYAIIARIVLTSPVTSVTFSRNNERLGAGSTDGTFALLNPMNQFEYVGEIEQLQPVDTLNSTTTVGATVTAVDWCSKNMAIGRIDGTVSIYDTKQVIDEKDSHGYIPITTIRRKEAVHCLAFGVSSRFLAVGGASAFVGIYSSKGSWVLCHQVSMMVLPTTSLSSLPSPLPSPSPSPTSIVVESVRWSPSGRYLACCSSDGRLKVIDTIFWADVNEAAEAVAAITATTTNQRHGLSSTMKCISFSQDGNFLAVAQSIQGMTVLNTTTNWTVDFHFKNLLLGEYGDDKDRNNNNDKISGTTASITASSVDEEEYHDKCGGHDGQSSSSLSSYGPEDRQNRNVSTGNSSHNLKNNNNNTNIVSNNPLLFNLHNNNTNSVDNLLYGNNTKLHTSKESPKQLTNTSFIGQNPEVSFADDDFYYFNNGTSNNNTGTTKNNHVPVVPSLLYPTAIASSPLRKPTQCNDSNNESQRYYNYHDEDDYNIGREV